MNIDQVLYSLGFFDGWAADHQKGIILWLRSETQPTKEQLILAGWLSEGSTAEEWNPDAD